MATVKEHAEIEIGGMTCEACVRTVEKRLNAMPSVLSAKVDLKAQTALVEYEPSRVHPADLAAAVEKLGYTAQVK